MDPEDAHLYKSLGCAAENLVQAAALLAELRQAGTGDGVWCVLITSDDEMAAVSSLVERGNLAQLEDEAFRDELLTWIRFNPQEATRTRDGLAGKTNGQPPLPTFLGRMVAPWIIKASTQAKVDRERLKSSAGVAIFLSASDTKPVWVEAGRVYERFSLRADLLDIRTAFINQPIEVPALRDELASLIGNTGRPQLMVRFGHGQRGPYSLRRPVDDVICA